MTEKPQQKPLNPILGYLLKTYPKAFDLKNRKPLKIRIHKEIHEQMSEPKPTMMEIRKALKKYTMSRAYAHGMVTNTHRIDLEGNLVEEVSEQHKTDAQAYLDQMKQRTQQTPPKGSE